jgi:outer membrane immunogenic protein
MPITNKTAIVMVAVAAFIGMPALAAPPTFPSSWTGCYVGINGGYGWSNGSSGYNDTNIYGDPINFVPAPFSIFGTPNLVFITRPGSTGGSGGIAGGTGGCNFQITKQWLIGFEADMDAAHIAGSGNNSANSGPRGQFALGAANVPPFGVGYVLSGVNALGTANEQINLQWLSTIRARGGLLVADHLLLFATGGLALGGINSQGSVNVYNNLVATGLTLTNAWSGSTTSTRVGGTVGAGLEWAVSGPFSVKAEYLFYTFGNVSHPLTCSLACNPTIYPTLGNASSSVYGNIARIGVNYKFW